MLGDSRGLVPLPRRASLKVPSNKGIERTSQAGTIPIVSGRRSCPWRYVCERAIGSREPG